MIERINPQISVGVDKASRKAAEALEKVTDRVSGKPKNAVDRNIAIRLNSQYSENYLNARNAQDGISYLQVRDGALDGVTDRLGRMRELAVQMGNPALNDGDKDILRQEANMLMEDIEASSKQTNFNGHRVIEDMNLGELGLDGFDITTEGAIATLDGAIQHAATTRAETGAASHVLGARIENYAINNERLAGAAGMSILGLAEDVTELADATNRLMTTLEATDTLYSLDKNKVMSLLDIG
jgi:flagellin